MRFPWQHRADRFEGDTEQAKKRLQDVHADWPRVRATVEETDREREMNGWTRTITTLFSGH